MNILIYAFLIFMKLSSQFLVIATDDQKYNSDMNEYSRRRIKSPAELLYIVAIPPSLISFFSSLSLSRFP